MARRTRGRRGFSLFSRLYSPVSHALSAGKESLNAVANTAKGLVGTSVKGVDKVGHSVTTHFNAAVRDLVKRKSRKSMSGGKRRRNNMTMRKRRNNMTMRRNRRN